MRFFSFETWRVVSKRSKTHYEYTLYFLYRDGMSHLFSTWQKQNITTHILLFFWVNCSKVKTGMFKVLHYPHPANICWFYYWLWICKCLLGRIFKFIFKWFHTKINCNCLKRSNIEMSGIPLREQSVRRGT